MKYHRCLILSAIALAWTLTGWGQSLQVIQTASTNRPKVQVTMDGSKAMLASNEGLIALSYSSRERKSLWHAVAEAGPLADLPVSHCMKSASFGYRLFVDVDGQRSPDLSCGNQTDPRAATLHDEAEKILKAARTQMHTATHGTSWK